VGNLFDVASRGFLCVFAGRRVEKSLPGRKGGKAQAKRLTPELRKDATKASKAAAKARVQQTNRRFASTLERMQN